MDIFQFDQSAFSKTIFRLHVAYLDVNAKSQSEFYGDEGTYDELVAPSHSV